MTRLFVQRLAINYNENLSKFGRNNAKILNKLSKDGQSNKILPNLVTLKEIS